MPVLVKKKEYELTQAEEELFFKYVRPGQKGMTHVFAILDQSGSMYGLTRATIDGYNEFIGGLKGKSNIKVSLTLFDTYVKDIYHGRPIAKVPELDEETYRPQGWTSLLDAVCGTLSWGQDEVKKGDKAVVLIITDGMENSSKEYKGNDLKKLITKLEKKDNWTFTYLGANQDSWAIAQKWGFQRGNVANYNATEFGTQTAYRTASMSVGSFSAGPAGSSGLMFSDEDKEKLKKAK